MLIRYILLAITGLSAGAMISAGVFALISSTGVITRMAGKTHTGKNVRIYETFIILGGIWWNIFWIFNIHFHLTVTVANILNVIIGLFQGIFVGCLAVSLAEALNTTAIFSRRIKLKMGLSFVILAAAIGKSVLSLIQFVNGWVK